MANLLPGEHPCPACGSSDGVKLRDDGSAYCFVCKTSFKDYENDEVVEKKPSKYTLRQLTPEEVKELPVKGFREREITTEVSKFYDVRTSFNQDGIAAAHYYPYGDNAYKVRNLPKDFTWINKGTAYLFGMDKFNGGGKRLVITEGELDAMTVAQASLDRWKRIYPAISISSATATKPLLENRDWIRSFDEVVIWFDNDEAGKEATADALKYIGLDKCKVVNTPGIKDASKMYTEKGSDAVNQAIFDAAPHIPKGIVTKEDIWSAIAHYNEIPSVPYPACLAGLNTKLKGQRPGEIVLFTSGCLGEGTPVYHSDGHISSIEDVHTGDQLLGDDNIPREVLAIVRGTSVLYRVEAIDGSSFVCNEDHVLTVVNINESGRYGLKSGDILDVPLKEYLGWSARRKHYTKLLKMSEMHFDEFTPSCTIEPYVLGAWLGDGNSDGAAITTADPELITHIGMLGYTVTKYPRDISYGLPGRLRRELNELNLLNNKHIPEEYLRASKRMRMELLAGLLDTDGSYDPNNNGYEFSQKKFHIISDVQRLAESLGFKCKLGKQKNNPFGNCYRLWISGRGLDEVPVVIPRKKARPRMQIKDPNRYGFTVRPIGVGEHYGVVLDGNQRHVLGNGFITHNSGSGKSTILREIVLDLVENYPDHKVGILSLEESTAETGRKLCGMAIHKNVAEYDVPLDELRTGFDKVFGSDRIMLLDHQGSMGEDTLMEKLEYMCLSGCTDIVIDHLTILISESSENLRGLELQDKILNDLLRLVKRYPINLKLVSHLRKAGSGNKSFEEGIMPSLDDIRGSGSTKQVSFDIIAFTRNLIADDADTQNTVYFRVLKSRYTGLTGDVPGCKYNFETSRMKYSDKMLRSNNSSGFEELDDGDIVSINGAKK